ncbi:TadE/TadG family type IV pilus assembly protein [Histidinibacterium aquaticum]|uniref:Pilus assembly protein n=1 Tax=Histidinibacterium aquaticum TaxID=2613962 RepID=A0A5J5GQD4_9RHOB|nr:TadE family protein [Histidinibacterium aquaticum]KAA9009774.1 pilus assembly protein [Histidinibacterium aquaticum]
MSRVQHVLPALSRLWRRMRREEGSVTLEYVLWLPVWLLIMTLTVDATMLFQQRSQFYVAARDTSRLVAVGAKTASEAETLVEQGFSRYTGFDASVTMADGFVTTAVSAPFSSITAFSGYLASGNLTAAVTMYVEAPSSIASGSGAGS